MSISNDPLWYFQSVNIHDLITDEQATTIRDSRELPANLSYYFISTVYGSGWIR